MKQNSMKLTTAQFAKIHEVNKRTLHYYDSIGLFSPESKGENGYRYYDISQSIDFEYIRMLKELNMTIEEIQEYFQNPAPDKFLKIANAKEKEIDNEIKRLQHTKTILQTKKEQLLFCESLNEQKIRIEECSEEKIYVLPFDFADNDISKAFSYVKDKWSIEQIRMGIGGFISLDKVKNNNFEKYDGLFTPVLEKSDELDVLTITKGKYLCGYQKGTWDKLPDMYKKMLAFAKANNLKLTGYAYEQGLNEFVISAPEEYVTKIMIKIE